MPRSRYEHVWNNGNNGTGKVMETWALTEATHKQPTPPPEPPACVLYTPFAIIHSRIIQRRSVLDVLDIF